MFTLCDTCISWKSQLQSIVALSTKEVEYMTVIEAIKKSIWLKGSLSKISELSNSVVVYFDSQSAIYLCKNSVFHERSKHIDIRMYFIRDIIAKKSVTWKKFLPSSIQLIWGQRLLPLNKYRSCLQILRIDTS